MKDWLKILILVIVFLALGFFGTKFIGQKIDSTVQEQDEKISGSSGFSENGSEESEKEGSNFGSFGDLFKG